ncbi:MAG: sigma70-ECF: polymerase sigma factor, sigma-70 family [Anaerosporomusa subterranea]|jgi:RNA polymerase sigma factor (sigma-70 family)|nr:sigma70-ECF: polymerase sigma factor, sigma-70 family [Anaerosporomusa subterranea]
MLELQEMVLQAQRGDAAAYYTVCCQFRGLVMKHARQGHLAGIRDDAESEGWLALAQAVKDYDPARGVPFAGYAERCVSYRLWNVFKKERRRWQTESPLEDDRTDEDGESDRPSLLERLAASDDVAGEAQQRELRAELRQALLTLPERQRQAVVATLIGEGRLVDLATVWGVSVQAVHATRKKALLKLKQIATQRALIH